MKSRWLNGTIGVLAELAYALLYILAGLLMVFILVQAGNPT